MTEPSFDPGGFFQFDLAKGSVRSRGGGRVLLVSENVLSPLINTAVAHGDLTAVRSLGSQLGSIVAASLGATPSNMSPSQVIGHAGSVMSLFGWGRLRLEMWGEALVLHVEGLPPLDEDNLAVAALLGGLFSTLCTIEVACVPIARTARYMMVDPRIAEQVWTWAKEGESLAAIASKLAAVPK
jgi:membrane protein YqaA with SNARE-associated domain